MIQVQVAAFCDKISHFSVAVVQRRMYKLLFLLSPRRKEQMEPEFRCMFGGTAYGSLVLFTHSGHSAEGYIIIICHRG
jgi:hypothetical protein